VPGSVVIKTVRAHPAGSDAGARTAEQKSLTATSNRVSTQLSEQENARAVQQDLAKSREARCKTAKDLYMRAITSRRVYKEDKDGERTFMSDQEADTWREQLRKATQDACGSVPQFERRCVRASANVELIDRVGAGDGAQPLLAGVVAGVEVIAAGQRDCGGALGLGLAMAPIKPRTMMRSRM